MRNNTERFGIDLGYKVKDILKNKTVGGLYQDINRVFNMDFANAGQIVVDEDTLNINIKLRDFYKKLKYTKYYQEYIDIVNNYDKKFERIRNKRLENRELRRWYSKYERTKQLWGSKPKNESYGIGESFISNNKDSSSFRPTISKFAEMHIKQGGANLYKHSDLWVKKLLNRVGVDLHKLTVRNVIGGSDLESVGYCDVTTSRLFLDHSRRKLSNIVDITDLEKFSTGLDKFLDVGFSDIEFRKKSKDFIDDLNVRLENMYEYKVESLYPN